MLPTLPTPGLPLQRATPTTTFPPGSCGSLSEHVLPWAALQALAHHTGRSLVSVSLAAITTNQELFDLMNSCSYPVSGSHRPNTLGFGSVIFILVGPSFPCLNSARALGPQVPCSSTAGGPGRLLRVCVTFYPGTSHCPWQNATLHSTRPPTLKQPDCLLAGCSHRTRQHCDVLLEQPLTENCVTAPACRRMLMLPATLWAGVPVCDRHPPKWRCQRTLQRGACGEAMLMMAFSR